LAGARKQRDDDDEAAEVQRQIVQTEAELAKLKGE
jgi:hypothetical protein